ncbi:MAG: hypothetical protein K9J30_10735 [Bacteroidales bacterium]|nr:hypothetical protein [Bacteroidales bacterium]
MKKIVTVCFLTLIMLPVLSQQGNGYIEIIKAEAILKDMFDQLYDRNAREDQSMLFHKIDSVFELALNLPGSFDHRWEKLDKIGRIKSDDGVIKIFSWFYMKNYDEYLYSAIIQVRNRRNDAETYKLIPGTSSNIKGEEYPQRLNDWHGKVYYDVVTNHERRRTYYTLLGLDMNDTQTTMKSIEVITLKRGEPAFISECIMGGGQTKDRMVLEYSSDITASLRYNKDLDMIVFDHLVPMHPIYEGLHQFYGPDGSYDGLRFVDGVWVLEEDVDARNK